MIAALVCLSLFLFSCQEKEGKGKGENGKIGVIVSLFPLYEFAKNVGGDRAAVALLVTPGTEPHSYEPKPADILLLNRAGMFIYTNRYMEPWIGDILKGTDNKELLVVDASRNIDLMKEAERENGHAGHEGKKGVHNHMGLDPHLWLDLSNAMRMVDTIRDGFIMKDPGNESFYHFNAATYKEKLASLDKKFRGGLSSCEKKIFITGGHFSFGYLARRYGLSYISAYGFSPDAEPSPRMLADITKAMKLHDLRHIFYEELISPRVAETISRETGSSMLMLHGAHNISREEFERGASFIEIMEKNLQNLRIGLQCQ
jgi:zinc transport system substrate-binding protein